jgi:hypothetical protein
MWYIVVVDISREGNVYRRSMPNFFPLNGFDDGI